MSNQYNKTPFFILIQKIAILLCLIIAYFNYSLLYEKVENFTTISFNFLLSYFLSDILSGFIHWAGDNLGNENTPFFGKNFIKPFRLHHISPNAMCKIDLLENLGSSFILILIPEFLILLKINYSTLTVENGKFYLLLQNTLLFSAMTNLFHRWAHLPEKNLHAIIRFLQKNYIILNPNLHKKHHSCDFDTTYCVTNGWGNFLLDRISFWKKISSLVRNFN